MSKPQNSKIKIVCNHCDDIVEWYSSRLEEVGFSRILCKNKKRSQVYCDFCVREIARFFVEEAEL